MNLLTMILQFFFILFVVILVASGLYLLFAVVGWIFTPIEAILFSFIDMISSPDEMNIMDKKAMQDMERNKDAYVIKADSKHKVHADVDITPNREPIATGKYSDNGFWNVPLKIKFLKQKHPKHKKD